MQGWMVSDARGNVAIAFALLAPVLLGAAGAALDFASYSSALTELQETVDAAAIAGAREYLASKQAGDIAEERAEHAARSIFGNSDRLTSATASAVAIDAEASVTVTASFSFRPSFFVAMFKSPLTLGVASTAQASGGANICVIGLEENDGDAIRLNDSAELVGSDCAVYSNSRDAKGLMVHGGARLQSGFTCSAGGFGDSLQHFNPAPLTDCPKRDDPLADRIEPIAGACDFIDRKVKDFRGKLEPGVYCGGLVIDGESDVTLGAGVYVFRDGGLQLKDRSSIAGENTGLFFTGENAAVKFEDKSSVSLSAPETGAMAGVLIWQSRASTGVKSFEIFSNNVDELVGTIYLPDSEFHASATAEVAEDSAYTAIIARRIRLDRNTRLVLNTDYAQTAVPVPAGVANAGGAVILRN